MSSTHHALDYVELFATDLEATKAFFNRAFGWEFIDYGEDYSSFSDQGLNGGFQRSDACNRTSNGGALLVLYTSNIERTLQAVESSGGTIIKPIFEFPGGCRFHFTEPSGNEFAAWSEHRG